MTHPVARELRKIVGVRFFQRFDDWLELSLAAFCRDEERYMETMRRYGPREPGKDHPADHFAAALGEVHLAMAKDNDAGVIHDHLGEIYETEGASEKEMAQFFTSMPLCQLMGRMTIDEATPQDAVISDPACGSGRFFLAVIPLRPNAHFVGVDVDRTCAKMAALNMLWRNANATIVWGDTLRLTAKGGWASSRTALGGVITSFGAERAQAVLEGPFKRRVAPEVEPQTVTQSAVAPTETSVTPPPNKRGQFELDL